MGPVHLNTATGCKNKQTRTYPPVPVPQGSPEPEDKDRTPLLSKGQLWRFSLRHNHRPLQLESFSPLPSAPSSALLLVPDWALPTQEEPLRVGAQPGIHCSSLIPHLTVNQ